MGAFLLFRMLFGGYMNNDIKKILKNSIISSLIVFLYGILVRSAIVYIGMFVGSLISIMCFYSIYMEAEAAIRSDNAFRITLTGYVKRYVIYGVFLGVLLKFFGTSMCVGGAMGLLNVKANIALTTVTTFFKKLVNKLDKIK